MPLNRMQLNRSQLFARELEVLQRSDQFGDLSGMAGANQGRGHTAITQHPGNGHLGQTLPPCQCQFIQGTHMLEIASFR